MMITGSSMYLGTFAQWTLDYAQKTKAVIVSPNYQKLPDAKGLDLLADLDDLSTWVQRALGKEVGVAEGEVEVDLDRLLAIGSNAGAFPS